MLKKSTSILLAVYFLVLFVFYQVFMLNSTWNSDMAVNPSHENVLEPSEFDQVLLVQNKISQKPVEYVIIGNPSSSVTKNAKEALNMLKFNSVVIPEIVDLKKEQPACRTVLYTTGAIMEGDLGFIKKALSEGVNIIFCTMPDIRQMDEVKELLGIFDIGGQFDKKGYCFYDGMLLGGMHVYKDLVVKTNYVTLMGKSKVFAAGNDKEIFDYENVPIIWRTYYERGAVWVINADFMEDFSGAGILSAILSKLDDVFIYPVINSKTILVDGIPTLTKEHEEFSKLTFGRTYNTALKEVVWPNLVALFSNTNTYATIFITPYITNEFKDGPFDLSFMDFLSKELSMGKYELGIGHASDDKADAYTYIAKSMELISEKMNNYEVKTAITDYLGKYANEKLHITGIPTFMNGKSENFGFKFISNDAVTVPVVATSSSRGEDMIFKSLNYATLCGYSSYMIDFNEFFAGKGAENAYRDFSKDFYEDAFKLMTPLKSLESLTVSDTAERIKKYITEVPEITITNDKITIESENGKGSQFILRTELPFASVQNAEVSIFEKYVYVVKTTDNSATINFKKRD